MRMGEQKKDDKPTTSRQSTGGNADKDVPWEIAPEAKAKFDGYFELLDIDRDGFVEGTREFSCSVFAPLLIYC